MVLNLNSVVHKMCSNCWNVTVCVLIHTLRESEKT